MTGYSRLRLRALRVLWSMFVITSITLTALALYRSPLLERSLSLRDLRAGQVAFITGAAVSFVVGKVKVLRYATTLLHEIGHAWALTFLGGVPDRITIATDTSGSHEGHVHPGRMRVVLIALAGQQGPVLAALSGALLFNVGRPDLALTATGAVGLFTILFALRSRTALVIGAMFASVTMAGVLVPVAAQALIAGALIGFTAAAGLRLCWVDVRIPGSKTSDEGVISTHSGVPVRAVVWFQLVLCAASFISVAWVVLAK